MNRRVGLVLALLVVFAGAYKVGPRVYNRIRLRQLQGHPIYDEHADAQALFDRALARANGEHKRLLVILGGNWCQWCLALHDLMERDDALRAQLSQHFVVLDLDSQAAHALDERWGHPTRQGVPVLIFIDDQGAAKHVQETVSLELWHGRLLGHDPARVLEVLRRWT
jgi:thiol:disulfide interchange protein